MTEGQAVEKPSPSRRAIIGWTVAMLAFLGLAYFAGAVVVPCLETRREVARCEATRIEFKEWGVVYWKEAPVEDVVKSLGGRDRAAGRLGAYLRWPRYVAPHRQTAAWMLVVGSDAPVDRAAELLEHADADVRIGALAAIRERCSYEQFGRVDALLARVAKDPDADVRAHASTVALGVRMRRLRAEESMRREKVIRSLTREWVLSRAAERAKTREATRDEGVPAPPVEMEHLLKREHRLHKQAEPGS